MPAVSVPSVQPAARPAAQPTEREESKQEPEAADSAGTPEEVPAELGEAGPAEPDADEAPGRPRADTDARCSSVPTAYASSARSVEPFSGARRGRLCSQQSRL